MGIMLSLGIVGTFSLNNFLKETYISRKSELEESIENFLNKKVDLGDYSGIRFLGISLTNLKIFEKENKNSEIKAKNIFVGVMPIRSFLNQKLVIKIKPAETNINIDKDFLKRINSKKKEKISGKSKINYDLIFKLNNFASFKLEDSGLETKVKGDIIYKSKKRNIIANLKSNFDGKGFINLKLNSNLNKDLYSLEVFSKGVNLDNYEFICVRLWK